MNNRDPRDPRGSLFSSVSEASFDTVPETIFTKIEDSFSPQWQLVAFSRTFLGDKEEEHGEKLLLTFFETLAEPDITPDEILFYHKGVYLCVKESPFEKIIEKLASCDVRMFAAQESCTKYGVEPYAKIVCPISMSELSRHLLRADKVLHL